MRKQFSRRDFLKTAGIATAGLALSACGVKGTESPTETNIPPTAAPTVTSTPNFANLTACINTQIDKIANAYQLIPGFHVAKSVKLQNLVYSPTIGKYKGFLN